jgi:tetratricopeptide (TPR) repeat protein
MDALTDQQVWANRYDRAMEEIFTVQTEIADEVVKSLGVTLAIDAADGQERTPTEDMTAYHSYLRAKDILDGSSYEAESWLLAADLLEKTVARDPDFHEAWAFLARAAAGLCHFNFERTEARLAQAKLAAKRALALAPGAAASHLAQGTYYYWGLKDYAQALASFREADRLRPQDPKIMESIAYVLRRLENYEEAAELLLSITELSPQDPSLCYHLAETLGIVARYDEALKWIEKGVVLGPDKALIYSVGGWVAVQAGRSDKARDFVGEIPPSADPEVVSFLVRINTELRDFTAALAEAQRLPPLYEQQYNAIGRDIALAMTHRAMGQQDLAREEFTRAEAVIGARLAEKPDAGNLVAAHGVALVGMGRTAEGLDEVQRSFDLFPASKDLWIQTYRLYDLAYAQTLADEPGAAVQTLTELMKRQTDVISPAILVTSPHFDDLREREDFKALLAAVS